MNRIQRQSSFHFENVGSTLLNWSENQMIFDFLGQRCFTLATGVAQLLYGNMIERKWELIGRGVICYVRDYNRKEVSVQLIDIDDMQSASNNWKLTISPTVIFMKKHSNLVAFYSDDDMLYGINFSLSSEANNFWCVAEKEQAVRRQRIQRREIFENAKRKEVQTEITTIVPFNNCTENGNVEPSILKETQIERTQPTDSHSEESQSKEVPKSIRGYVLETLQNTTTLQRFIGNRFKLPIPSRFSTEKEKKQRNLKKKKEKRTKDRVDRPEIGLPTNFIHKAHCGVDAFVNESELDETVRRIYEFVQQDISKADKKEIDMIRRRVSVYGPERVRRSMRRLQSRKEQRKQRNDSASESNDGSLLHQMDASNASPPKQPFKFPSTPHDGLNLAIKNEFERRRQNVLSTISEDRENVENTMQKNRFMNYPPVLSKASKTVSTPSNVTRYSLPPMPPPKPVVHQSPSIKSAYLSMVMRTSNNDTTLKKQFINDDNDYESENHANMTMQKHLSRIDSPNDSLSIKPKFQNSNSSRLQFQDSSSSLAAVPLPSSTPPTLSYVEPSRSINYLSTNSSNSQVDSDPPYQIHNASPTPFAATTPPPPPPLPPPQTPSARPNNTGAFSISEGRQNLLEAIRNADRSALRKVTHEEEENAISNTSPTNNLSTESVGDLMSAIGKMIEERRRRINDSSDDDASDMSDEDDLEDEWSN